MINNPYFRKQIKSCRNPSKLGLPLSWNKESFHDFCDNRQYKTVSIKGLYKVFHTLKH